MSSSEAPEQTPSANSSSAPEGLSAFTAKVLDQLSLSAWLPAAFVTLSGSIVLGFRANNGLNLTPLIAYVNDHPWTFGLLAVPTVVCLTLLTQAFSYEAIRLLEGYWRWPGPADWVRSLMVSWHTGRSRRNSQILWIGVSYAASDWSGRSTCLPLTKGTPARTRATRWGAFTIRHRDWAASMSLNAIAMPAAREPGPLVTR